MKQVVLNMILDALQPIWIQTLLVYARELQVSNSFGANTWACDIAQHP